MEYNIYGGFKDMVQILNTNQNQKKKKKSWDILSEEL